MQREQRTASSLGAGLIGADERTTFERDSLSVGGFFPTPLVSARLANHQVLNATLTRTILLRREVERGVAVSNVGGWHSAEFLSWCGSPGDTVVEAAREMVDTMTLREEAGGLVAADIGWRVTAWANVNVAGDTNRAHGHAGAFWSGIYWVDDGGAGADQSMGGLLEISDPRGILPSMNAPHLRYAVKDCLSAGRGELVTPVAGTMVLFPAWLMHSVTAYRGERPRISVAFNFSI